MNPDVVRAIARLRTRDILSSSQAALFDRVARRSLVSLRLEMRALLYAGVLLVTSGVGILVSEHQREIGPLAIATAIALAAACCLVWVARTAAPFTWGEAQSPNVAFDYILLLGLLLFASDLVYVEVQFTVLGPRWTYHLLVVGAVYLVSAYRWDSRTVLGLALTTLAAWRGISASLISGSLWGTDATRLRANAVAVGLLYVAGAALSVSWKRKVHFEEVFANAGLLLLLGALVSGALGEPYVWDAWLVALLVAAGLVVWLSLKLRRSLYFAQGIVAAYLGLLRLLFEPFHHGVSGIPFLLAALLAVGALALVFAAHRRMREP